MEKCSSVCIFSSWEAKSIVVVFNFTLCDFKNEEKCSSVVQKRRRSFSWTDAVGCWRELLCVFYYAHMNAHEVHMSASWVYIVII